MDEYDWISDRLVRLRYLRFSLSDATALSALDALIAEGEQRLTQIRERPVGPPEHQPVSRQGDVPDPLEEQPPQYS